MLPSDRTLSSAAIDAPSPNKRPKLDVPPQPDSPDNQSSESLLQEYEQLCEQLRQTVDTYRQCSQSDPHRTQLLLRISAQRAEHHQFYQRVIGHMRQELQQLKAAMQQAPRKTHRSEDRTWLNHQRILLSQRKQNWRHQQRLYRHARSNSSQ